MSKPHHTHKRERYLKRRSWVVIGMAVLGVGAIAAGAAILIGDLLGRAMP